MGDTVTDKEFRPDINVILNNNTLINLGMQIKLLRAEIEQLKKQNL